MRSYQRAFNALPSSYLILKKNVSFLLHKCLFLRHQRSLESCLLCPAGAYCSGKPYLGLVRYSSDFFGSRGKLEFMPSFSPQWFSAPETTRAALDSLSGPDAGVLNRTGFKMAI